MQLMPAPHAQQKGPSLSTVNRPWPYVPEKHVHQEKTNLNNMQHSHDNDNDKRTAATLLMFLEEMLRQAHFRRPDLSIPATSPS
eukprot:4471317-Amphidinium_carterae.1